jgi:hypothetical protein
MTLTEVLRELPWGLHDAYLVKVNLDYDARLAAVEVRLQLNAEQTVDRLARLSFTGLEWFTALPPSARHQPDDELPWVDQLTEGHQSLLAACPTFAVPAGCFVAGFYTRESWQRFAVCSREVTLVWLEPAPVPSRFGRRSVS